MLKVKSPQDLGAGLLFLAIGIAGFYFGRELQFGTARSMGPGYFPSIVSGLIALIGVVVAVKSLAVEGPAIERFRFRPIFMLIAALAIFGFLVQEIGIILSSFLLIVVAAYAQSKVRIVETLVFALCMSAFVVLVFVYGLNQPMPLWWNG